MKKLTRREILSLALASPLAAAMPGLDHGRDLAWGQTQRRNLKAFGRQSFIYAPSNVVTLGGGSAKQVKLVRRWKGVVCQSRLVNTGKDTVPVKEVVLFDLVLPLSPQTRLYGEGFQMLSQTGGTLGKPADLGNYTDATHYKLPAPVASKTLYGMMTLAPPEGSNFLLAFTSCRRFSGQFYLHDRTLQVVIDTEVLELKP